MVEGAEDFESSKHWQYKQDLNQRSNCGPARRGTSGYDFCVHGGL